MEEKKIFKIENRKIKRISFLASKYVDYNIIGLDTETINGELYSIQVFSKDSGISKFILYNGEDEADLIYRLIEECEISSPTLFFCHNLEYDMGVLFKGIIMESFKEIDMNESFDYKGLKFDIIYPKPAFLKVRSAKRGKFNGKIVLYFMDTLPFFRGSLDYMAKKLDLPVRKLKKPEYLGERKPTKEEFPYFEKYSMIDAEAVYYLGKEFMKFHEKYDVDPKTTISPASLSSKTFRRQFLKKEIPLPKNKMANYMALKSYWGGRTEAFCGGKVDIKVYDYNSFYPYAMSKIFLPTDETAWKYTDTFKSRFGFYRIRGEMPFMKVSPIPVKNERLMFPVGKFDVTTTGFEAEDILRYGKNCKIIHGYYYTGTRDYSMRKYVRHFYDEKNNIDSKTDPAGYTRAKLLLNSLYGKMIQINRGIQYWFLMDSYKPYGHRQEAGGMFNPVIASWITGFCRSELFKAMKKHEETIMYCDTDSLGICADDYGVKTGSMLGGLKLEGKGSGIIIKEKNYIISGEVDKVARHGFWGTDEEFKNYVNNNCTNYTIKRMVKLKEAEKTNKDPFTWEKRMRSLELVTSKKRANSRPMDFINDFKWLDPIKI